MLKINKKITPYNYTKGNNKKNLYIVIHYVGAVSTAKANANYFYNAKRGASAHYFVDENEIWQVVEDTDIAWHIGAQKYYNSARNSNSIGIEMCCKYDGDWYFEDKTIQNTIELVRYLSEKYNTKLIVRHYDCTLKNCPAPLVKDVNAWNRFLDKVQEKEKKEMLTLDEALAFLHSKGLIEKIDYWRNACECVKDLKFVFIKWANSVSTYNSENAEK